MGLELIGVKGTTGDKEVIDLAKKALTAVGLKNVQVTVGDASKISKKSKKDQEHLLNQDFVSLKTLPSKEDLVARNHDYYTGMIFQIYVPEFGYLIGSGGRYDDLLGRFGKSRPAVGFAFSLNRVLLALEAQS
jgi:ATP phosphoribosyltransferase regulatory subunit HisZ